MMSQIRKTVLYLAFRNVRLVSILLGVVIISIGTLVWLYPKYQGIRNQGLLDYGNKKENLENRQLYLERLEDMITEYDTINQQEVDDLKKLLPETQEIPELFVMLDQLSKDMGFVLERVSFTPGSVTKKTSSSSGSTNANSKTALLGTSNAYAAEEYDTPSQLGAINIVLGISSEEFSYARFKTMLETIESNMRILDLTTVNYNPEASSFSLSLTTYYLVS